MTPTVEKTEEFEMEIKLYLNKRLYKMELITEEMYSRAKEIIIKGLTVVLT